MNRKLSLACIVGGSLLVGCYEKNEPVSGENLTPATTSADVKKDAAKALKTASDYATEKKATLMQKWRDQLSTMDSQIEELRSKGDQLAADAKENWGKKMTELESKRQAAKDKITEMENSTEEAWVDLEKGAVSAWTDLKAAFQEASKDF